ncbi:deoxyribodipyrimidine photo-lyase [Aeromicrobium sp. CnD17-E]|uniref:deoxyribodipyrimidine photo-lyase n=1 Tax=Aeromicrobium sp. CnD17-E TaxID=2954487 RepID=UPI00209764D3|nr:deoxyribodipyrimidine photo-lyase [Aeromicrobium sp. CnD17-E]MCO7240115.1 deoxyribodipyrimidine photo-lyase [Aeromicrobium sp. CnD17-E]
MSTSVICFRSDFRLNDNPALREAIEAGPDGVVPMFVLDDHYWGPNGRTRLAYLMALLRDLDERVGGLTVVHGKPWGGGAARRPRGRGHQRARGRRLRPVREGS